ncbi:MAG: YqjD family protein [Enterobacteriaceae bacterium]|jgi:ElaB/YqjD/DUF883 family membrane-anchored ribosome-binding protein|nr:YqjD family protein [Enterobacteriaceae bacterium]
MPQKKNSEELRAELQSLADTLEEIIGNAEGKPKAELEKLRNKAEKILQDARSVLHDASDKLTDQTKEIAGRADNYVRDNPWTGVGIGAAVGIVLGVLLARR